MQPRMQHHNLFRMIRKHVQGVGLQANSQDRMKCWTEVLRLYISRQPIELITEKQCNKNGPTRGMASNFFLIRQLAKWVIPSHQLVYHLIDSFSSCPERWATDHSEGWQWTLHQCKPWKRIQYQISDLEHSSHRGTKQFQGILQRTQCHLQRTVFRQNGMTCSWLLVRKLGPIQYLQLLRMTRLIQWMRAFRNLSQGWGGSMKAPSSQTLISICIRTSLQEGLPTETWAWILHLSQFQRQSTLKHCIVWPHPIMSIWRLQIKYSKKFTHCHPTCKMTPKETIWPTFMKFKYHEVKQTDQHRNPLSNTSSAGILAPLVCAEAAAYVDPGIYYYYYRCQTLRQWN